MSNPAPSDRVVRPLSRMVAYSWSRHWPAEVLMGLSGGIVGLAPFALQRSLGAPQWTSPALIVLGQALWILAPAWPLLLGRMKRQATFTWIGLFSRGPLLLLSLASVTPVLGGSPGQGTGDWWMLFATFLLSNNLDAVYTPHRNALIRANYPLTARGRIYGLVTLVVGVAAMASSQAVGHILDHDPTIVRIVFPLAAVVGILGHVLMARVRWRYEGPTQIRERGETGIVREAMSDATKATRRTLREDRSFRDYEIGFMLYGLGFLSATPLIVTRFAQDPTFSPSNWANAERLALPATQLALVWVIGRLSDRMGVVYVAALSFLGLAPFFAWMGFVETPTELLLAYVLMGVCMAGVNVAWALGPLHFAPRGQAHHYSSVHVACVGVRSVLGPAIGWVVQNLSSYQAALIVSASLEVSAGLWMLRLARKVHVPA